MKTSITRQQAQQIKPNHFIGTLDECWDQARKNGYKGEIPVARLDGAQFKDTDSPSWTSVDNVLKNKDGECWYCLKDISPEWEYCEKESPVTGHVSKFWIDKKTGIKEYSNPKL